MKDLRLLILEWQELADSMALDNYIKTTRIVDLSDLRDALEYLQELDRQC
jgi:hypothetical protein